METSKELSVTEFLTIREEQCYLRIALINSLRSIMVKPSLDSIDDESFNYMYEKFKHEMSLIQGWSDYVTQRNFDNLKEIQGHELLSLEEMTIKKIESGDSEFGDKFVFLPSDIMSLLNRYTDSLRMIFSRLEGKVKFPEILSAINMKLVECNWICDLIYRGKKHEVV